MPKRSKFTEKQTTLAFRKVESGLPVEELCLEPGVSHATFFQRSNR